MNNLKQYRLVVLGISCVLSVMACSPKTPTIAASTNVSEQTVLQQNRTHNYPKADYLNRNIQDEIFYFVMPDRFHNANLDNDNGDPNRPISFGGLDVTSKWAFHGGDIAGVEAKLDYIESLGITSIWMTPILRNRAVQDDGFAHHGYWVVDFTEIDPHFGSNDDLKSLIAAAHKRNIKIFFDIITNHTADVIKYKECHSDAGKYKKTEQKGCEYISQQDMLDGKKYTPFVLADEQNVKVPKWLNDTQFYNNQGDSFWQGESAIKGDFVGLDDIDTSNPDVISGLTDVFKDLITEFKPDGFRIDTVKHVDIEFWQSFSPAIMQHAKEIGLGEFFLFGEVFDGNPAVLSRFTTAGKLPSVLDFGFAFNVRDVMFNNKKVEQLYQLFENDDYYRDHDSTPNELFNFLGNHDMGRVGNFIQQGQPSSSDKEQLQLAKLAHALMYFSRGIPVVYYGDEQGFTGDGGDVDAREDMDESKVTVYNNNKLIGTNKTTADNSFDTTHPLYSELALLAKTRLIHRSLRQGEHINRALDNEKRIYAFSRIDPSNMQDFMLVFNFSNSQQKFEVNVGTLEYDKLAGSDTNTIAINDGQLQLDLAPLSYVLLQSKKGITESVINGISMQAVYAENDRVFLPFTLAFNQPDQLNLAQIKVYGLDKDDNKTLLAFDTTAPYRAVLMPTLLANVTRIVVEADNFHGRSIVKTFVLPAP